MNIPTMETDMTNDLKDKTLLIAGGASGAGLALARQAISRGASVHIIGRSQEKLAKAKITLGDAITTHALDITNEKQVKALAGSLGPVDHLVTTAADLAFKPFLQLSDEDITRSFGAKFWGPVYLTRHLVAKLAKGGSITFVSGSAAYKATPGGSIVAAVNAALDGLARTLSLELSPLRVNIVSPGIFDSPTWAFLDNETRRQTLEGIGASLPARRVGSEDEIADAILFLIGNGFATGTILQLDGGANA